MWQFTVDVSNIFHNDDMSLLAKGHAMASRIRHSQWYLHLYNYTSVGELETELRELEAAGNNPWLFDEAWCRIYDMADKDRCLIITLEDHQHERHVASEASSKSGHKPTPRDAEVG